MNVEIKRLSTCSFQTALDVWNEGFHGYFVDLTLSLDKFLARVTSECLSPELSFIAFVAEKPVGFLLNGIRANGVTKLAWNGGTGVITSHRGKGIGRALVNASIELYEAHGVEVATLEALRGNESAIKLYRGCGYSIVEELTFLDAGDSVPSFDLKPGFTVRQVSLSSVGALSFYPELSAWQTQWQSLLSSNGEAIIFDDSGGAVGYGLYKKRYDADGTLANVALCQCEVAPDRDDAEHVAAHALQRVFFCEPGSYRRTTHNFRKSNQLVVRMLEDAGFTTFIEQVHMIKRK
jgi:ribosomal protein S18 acetylase RimI-like enzyme